MCRLLITGYLNLLCDDLSPNSPGIEITVLTNEGSTMIAPLFHTVGSVDDKAKLILLALHSERKILTCVLKIQNASLTNFEDSRKFPSFAFQLRGGNHFGN